LWTSPYNIAGNEARIASLLGMLFGVRDPSIECDDDASVNPKQQSAQLAMAGVTETRTRAMEGWMPPCITGSSKDAHRPSTLKWCAGEKFTSFRQFSRRFAYCLVSGLDATKQFMVQPIELIRPGALYMRPTAGVQPGNDRTQFALYAPNTKAEVSGSPLSFTAGMYAFWRGSIRVAAWMDPRSNPPQLLSGHLEYSRQIVDNNIIDDNIENFLTPIGYETPGTKQFAEFQIPYYSPTIVSSTWSHGVDNQFDTPLANLVLNIPDFSGTSGNVFPLKIAVAGGDDMDFHQFIGPPPVINVADLTTTGRALHYPPTGFTPTQKIAHDTARTEEPAQRFVPVSYSVMRVMGNPTGSSCPVMPSLKAKTLKEEEEAATALNGSLYTAKQQKKAVYPRHLDDVTNSEGYDTVDNKQRVPRSIPDVPCTTFNQYGECLDSYYQDPRRYIID